MGLIGKLAAWLKRALFGTSRPAPGASPWEAGRGPRTLIVFRHAEKTGNSKDPHLSNIGRQRAVRLAERIPAELARPDFLIAAATSKRSSRPRETIEPLAEKLGLDINEQFDDEDVDALVEELAADRYKGKVGVISWRHSDLPPLLAALGAADGTYPDAWPDSEYDLMIQLDYPGSAAPRARRVDGL